jgi:hypothetical protein
MNEIVQVIGFACMANILVDFISHFNMPRVPDKPFRCDMCMGVWISIIPFCMQFGWAGLLYASITGISANLLYKYI